MGYYGKREAEAEPEPEAEADPLLYTTGIHAPVVSTVHGGVAHGLTTYSHGVAAVAPVHTVAAPLVSSVYGGHYYGKREAEPYTIGQVYAGLPYANAYATGHAHNVG